MCSRGGDSSGSRERFTVLIKGFTASLKKKKKKKWRRGEGGRGEEAGSRKLLCVIYIGKGGEGRVFVPLPVNE